HLPPLRERREDIPPLAAHFLRLHAQRYRKNVTARDPEAMRFLQEHGWPGNVRELDHAIERAVLMAQGNLVKASDLALRAGLEIRNPRSEIRNGRTTAVSCCWRCSPDCRRCWSR